MAEVLTHQYFDDIQLPFSGSYGGVSYNGFIYILANNKIYKYDTINKTFTLMLNTGRTGALIGDCYLYNYDNHNYMCWIENTYVQVRGIHFCRYDLDNNTGEYDLGHTNYYSYMTFMNTFILESGVLCFTSIGEIKSDGRDYMRATEFRLSDGACFRGASHVYKKAPISGQIVNRYYFGSATKPSSGVSYNDEYGIMVRETDPLYYPRCERIGSYTHHNGYSAFSHGTDMYILGGNNHLRTITKLDTLTNVFTDLDLEIPFDLSSRNCIQLNNNEYYIFNNGVYKLSFIDYNLTYDFSDNNNIVKSITGQSPITKIRFNYTTGTTVGFVVNTLSDTISDSFNITPPEGKILSGFSLISGAIKPQFELNTDINFSADENTTFYAVYKTYKPPTTTFDVVLYNLTSEDNKVDKSDDLTEYETISGVLREETSILNPTITIEHNGIINANYAYIEIWGRYYFIDEITSIRQNLWEISLSIDVLYTYKDAILNLTGFIDRNEFRYNLDIIDKKKVVKQGQNVTDIPITNNLFNNISGDFILTGFNIGVEHTNENNKKIVRTNRVSQENWVRRGDIDQFGETPFANMVILHPNEVGRLVIFLTRTATSGSYFDNPVNWLCSLRFFPFQIDKYNSMEEGYLFIGSHEPFDPPLDVLNLVGKNLSFESSTDYNIRFFNLGEYHYTRRNNDFRDFNGFTRIQLWLPYYGFIEINPNDVIGKYIQFRLKVDYFTGQAMYLIGVSDHSISDEDYTPFVSNFTEDIRILTTVTFNISKELPLGLGNSVDVLRNIQQAQRRAIVNTGLSLASMVISGKPIVTNTQTSESDSYSWTSRNPSTNRQVKQGGYTVTKNRTTTSETTRNREVYSGCFDSAIDALGSFSVSTPNEIVSNPIFLTSASQSIHILIYEPKYLADSYDVDFYKLYGGALGETKELSTLQGYTEISKIHVEGEGFENATSKEKSMIENNLLSGVIL